MPSTTPTVDEFLGGLANVVQSQNIAELCIYLKIEPAFPDIYNRMIQELRLHFPKGKEKLLENKVDGYFGGSLTEPWPAFHTFIAVYFAYLRDLNISDLLATFDGLGRLLQACKPAFSNPTTGVVLLDTIVTYAKVYAKLAVDLDNRPDLLSHLQESTTDPEGEGTTLPEKAANTIREVFLMCAQDRTPPGQPGKWPAAIKLANLSLRIMFRILKIKVTEQIFRSVNNLLLNHPLSEYSKADRVTFNYYAGRICFTIRQYYRASQLLEQAYLECHFKATKQRRAILVHLITANMIQGRFAAQGMLSTSDMRDIAPHFQALAKAIRLGDLASFRRLTTIDDNDPTSTANFLRRKRVLLQVRESCEMLVWRSLTRRVFILAGTEGKFIAERNVHTAPTLDINYITQVAKWLELRALDPESRSDLGPGKRNLNWVVLSNNQSEHKGDEYTDPDFAGLADEDMALLLGDDAVVDAMLPTTDSVEVVIASLIAEGFMKGYIAHAQRKFAVTGAKDAQSLTQAAKAGWPAVWRVFKQQNFVPERTGRAGGGRVVRMSGLKTIGAA